MKIINIFPVNNLLHEIIDAKFPESFFQVEYINNRLKDHSIFDTDSLDFCLNGWKKLY